jgi:TP901 family phage tail tape measure protein
MADTKLKLEVIMAAVDRITRPLKAVMDGSRQTSTEVKALRDKIKGLNDQAGQIESFRKLQSQTAVVGHNAAAAQDKVRQLAQQIQATEAPTKAMTKAFEAARREAGQLSTQHSEMTQRVQRQRDALNAAGLATNALASHQRRLKGEVQSTTSALEAEQKKLEEINQRAQRLKAAQAQYDKTKTTAGKLAGTGATMAVAGAAISAPVAKTVADYSKFEDAMLGVARQVDGARDGNGKLTKTYYDMANEIKRMATTIPLATVEIAKIVEAGARMGIQGKENLIEFAKTTAMTATAFDLPVDHIGEQMGKLAQLYKIPIPAISTLGDTINWLDDNALSKGGDIIDVMQRIAGTAAGVNMAAKEAAALGSTFLSLGSRAEVAATASNAMIRELSIATMQPKRFQEGIKALGLSAQGLQMGMPKDATGTILNVLDKLKALPSDKRLEVATRIFGKEYGDDAAKLAENLDEYRRQLKLVNDEKAKGSMQREGDARNQTLSAGGQIVKNKFFNLTSAIGETQRETVAQISQSIGDLLDRVTAFVQANPGFVGAVVKVTAALGTLAAVFGGVALAAAAILGPFAMARLAMTTLGIQTGGASAAMTSLKGAMLAASTNAQGAFARGMTAASTLASTAATTAASAWQKSRPDPKAWLHFFNYGIVDASARATNSTKALAKSVGHSLADNYRAAAIWVTFTTRQLWAQVQAQWAAIGAARAARMQAISNYIAMNGGIAGTTMHIAKMAAIATWARVKLIGLGSVNFAKASTMTILNGIGASLMFVGQAAAFVARALLLNPVGLAITVIALAALAILKYWQPIKAFFGGMWDGFVQGLAPLKPMFASVFGAIGDFLSPLKPVWDWIVGAMKSAWEWVSKLFSPFKATAEELANASKYGHSFGEGLANIVVKAAELVGKFAGFGKDIVMGLVNGITSAMGAAKEAITGLAANVIAWFKEKMGIKSPSRIFMEFGGHTVAGLQNGIEANASGPIEAVKAMSDKIMAAGAGMAIGMGATGAAAGPITIDTRPPITASAMAASQHAAAAPNITITVNAAPGMDEAALARLVAAEIDKATRRAQATKRSRLTDGD